MSVSLLAAAALAFGGAAALAAAMPALALEIPVMALYSVVFLGSTPIGAPLTGWLSQAYDPRLALVLAAIAGVTAAWGARAALARAQPGFNAVHPGINRA